MANETKSSPADHYFEPNGSNANAENIGHVLNDLTDIVASGTPEEGVDAVKWDGENFILGPGGMDVPPIQLMKMKHQLEMETSGWQESSGFIMMRLSLILMRRTEIDMQLPRCYIPS